MRHLKAGPVWCLSGAVNSGHTHGHLAIRWPDSNVIGTTFPNSGGLWQASSHLQAWGPWPVSELVPDRPRTSPHLWVSPGEDKFPSLVQWVLAERIYEPACKGGRGKGKEVTPVRCLLSSGSRLFTYICFLLFTRCLFLQPRHLPWSPFDSSTPCFGCHNNPSHSSGLTQWLSSFPKKPMKKKNEKPHMLSLKYGI